MTALGTSLVAQWLRLNLPMQAIQVQSLAKIPHALWPVSQNIKEKQYCNKFNKDFKNYPHQKTNLKKDMTAGPCHFLSHGLTRTLQ